MNKAKVLDLAKLARIKISDEEASHLSHEFDAILSYVGEVKGVTDNRQLTTDNNIVRNVMREDTNSHESGMYTEKILGQVPNREESYIKVKKIL